MIEPAQELLRVRAAIHVLLEAQGEIHPGWNNEYLEARWVRAVVTRSRLRRQRRNGKYAG